MSGKCEKFFVVLNNFFIYADVEREILYLHKKKFACRLTEYIRSIYMSHIRSIYMSYKAVDSLIE